MTTTTPTYHAPDGPRWIKNAKRGQTQVDGRGKAWLVTKVEKGGRIIRWSCVDYDECMAAGTPMGRQATTEIVASHPDYPSDAAVVAWEREQKRIERENRYPYY